VPESGWKKKSGCRKTRKPSASAQELKEDRLRKKKEKEEKEKMDMIASARERRK